MLPMLLPIATSCDAARPEICIGASDATCSDVNAPISLGVSALICAFESEATSAGLRLAMLLLNAPIWVGVSSETSCGVSDAACAE